MKRCTRCKKLKSKSEFYRDGRRKDGLMSQCKLCHGAWGSTKKWYLAHPVKAKEIGRKSPLKNHYNLTMDEYDSLLKKQHDKCCLCGDPEPVDRFKYLCVDHDHRTGKLRGLLCRKCNFFVGMVEENPLIFRKVTAYLSRHSRKKTKRMKS